MRQKHKILYNGSMGKNMDENNNKERMESWHEYFIISAEMKEAEEKFYANHWVHDHLDTPETLINILETKISRAVLAERARIKKVAENWISELNGHDGECDCAVQAKVLDNFIKHDDFNDKAKPEQGSNQ
jgi:hypothetical protein